MVYSSGVAKNRLSNETARRNSKSPFPTTNGQGATACHDLPQRDPQHPWPFARLDKEALVRSDCRFLRCLSLEIANISKDL
jgi:hypothetical protein